MKTMLIQAPFREYWLRLWQLSQTGPLSSDALPTATATPIATHLRCKSVNPSRHTLMDHRKTLNSLDPSC